MKRLLILALVVALVPGCLASLGLQIGNTSAPATQPTVGPGGSISSSNVNLRVTDGSSIAGPAWAALVGTGVLGVLFGGKERRAPELDASRAVHAQDCTRPLENPAANLRCR